MDKALTGAAVPSRIGSLCEDIHIEVSKIPYLHWPATCSPIPGREHLFGSGGIFVCASPSFGFIGVGTFRLVLKLEIQ